MERRRKQLQKRARDLEREARDRALTDEERIKRANRKLTRTLRAQQAASKARSEKARVALAIRSLHDQQNERFRTAEREKLDRAVSVLQSHTVRVDRRESLSVDVVTPSSAEPEQAAAKTPVLNKRASRPSMAPSVRATQESAASRLEEADCVNHVPKTLRELTRRSVVPSKMPARDDIEMSASCCVLCANVEEGVAFWGNDLGKFACPFTWKPLMNWLEDHYMRAVDAGCAGDIDDELVRIKHGEYNLVAQIKDPDALRRDGVVMPPLDYDEVVVRLTRPDGAERVSDTHGRYRLTRYKSRTVMQRELYFQLFASCNGIGLRCEAAFIYPGAVAHDSGAQMYGGLYVLQRAHRDMNKLIEEHSGRVAGMASEVARQNEQRLAGKRLAARTVQLLHHASALGLVAADVKPGNIVFDSAGAAYIIDFDGCMNTIMRSGTTYAPHVLHNLTLLTAHVRGFRETLLAEGWAAAVKPLMFDLVAASRGCRWLADAAPGNKPYAELPDDLEQSCSRRVEFVATSYFLRAKMANFRFLLGSKAPPLIVQLVRFGLFGATGGLERDVVWNSWAPVAPAWD